MKRFGALLKCRVMAWRLAADPSIPQILLLLKCSHPHLPYGHPTLPTGYFLYEDPHQTAGDEALPGRWARIYVASHLKAKGFAVEVFELDISLVGCLGAAFACHTAGLMGIYTNLMTRHTVLRMLRLAKELGVRVALGGPEPPH